MSGTTRDVEATGSAVVTKPAGPILYDRVCARCQKFCGGSSRSIDNINYLDLLQSARQGCGLCSLMNKSILMCPEISFRFNKTPRIRIESTSSVQAGAFPLNVWIFDPSNYQQCQISVYVAYGELSPFWLVGDEHLIFNDSNSDEFTRWLRGKNQMCVDAHPECRPETAVSLPKRVVDVGLSTSNIVSICETEQATGLYIALSHCWGTDTGPSTRTLASNIDMRYVGFALDRLPKTFRDAIFLTRKLGIRYLWIDTLCIIQDDMGDWELESVKMADYYGNAYLTIAALCSPGDNHGFLGPRDLFHIQSFEFDHAGTTYTIKVEDLSVPSRNPLLTRAWCFQELLFSRRLAMFGAMQLTWMCQHGEGSESKPSGRPIYSGLSSSSIRHLLDLRIASLDPFRAWNNIVDEYANMKLTQVSDRLPALSALAANFSHRNPSLGHYMSGLWKNHILHGLCWLNRTPTPQMPGYCAPTWSWASIQGLGSHAHRISGMNLATKTPLPLPGREITHVVHAECTPVGQNPFGQVQDGFLSLRCILLPVTLKFTGRKSELQDSESPPPYQYRYCFKIRLLDDEQVPLDPEFMQKSLQIFPDTILNVAMVSAPGGHTERTVVRATSLGWNDCEPFEATAWMIPIAAEDVLHSYLAMFVGRSPRVPGAYERIGFRYLLNPPSSIDNQSGLPRPLEEWWSKAIKNHAAQTIKIV